MRLVGTNTAEGQDESEMLRLAAAVEGSTRHPLADAVLLAASKANLQVCVRKTYNYQRRPLSFDLIAAPLLHMTKAFSMNIFHCFQNSIHVNAHLRCDSCSAVQQR